MEKLVIVGAGVAGLSCLNSLLDRGVSPLLLEAGTIGTPKLCGEFLAPPAVPILEQWGIDGLGPVEQVRFHAMQASTGFAFMRPAAAIQRHVAELALVARARRLGGRVSEHTSIQRVTPATESTPYVLELSSGDLVHAEHVMFATGKFTARAPQLTSGPAWVGFKTYIPGVLSRKTLDMFSLRGGYVGVIPVGDDLSNVTCLLQKRVAEAAGGCGAFVQQWLKTQPLLASVNVPSSVGDGLEGMAPWFGSRIPLNWPRAWWIGDALAAIHPAIGYGFAHSVLSARCAVEHYLNADEEVYRQRITAHVRHRLRWSRLLHYVLQRPWLTHGVVSCSGINTIIAQRVMQRLAY